MSDSEIRFSDRLRERFADQILRVIDSVDGPTVEIKTECWLEVARALRDEAEFRFEQAVDLCGVDYLGFGEAEWDTSDVSGEGFSRGVEGFGPGRFNWSERPEAAHKEQRYAVVVHLLSLAHGRRARIRCFAPARRWWRRWSLVGVV